VILADEARLAVYLYDATVFSNLASDFAIMSVDFGTVLTSLF
jgi:hypothetical protein